MRALYLKPRARRGKDMLSRTNWTQHGAGSSGGSAVGVHLRLRQDMHKRGNVVFTRNPKRAHPQRSPEGVRRGGLSLYC